MEKSVEKKRKAKLKRRETFALTLMCLIPVVLKFAFDYVPMFGIVLAFKDFRYDKGIWGSAWSGFENFDFLLGAGTFARLIRNTVGMGLLTTVVNTLVALTVAILLFEVRKRAKVKTYQTLMLLPYFISWVIVGYISYALLHPNLGIINNFLEIFGIKAVQWYNSPKYWPWIITIFAAWKSFGYGSIVYYASLMGIDSSYFEAARIDGANKWQEIRYVTLPSLIPIITIQQILGLGSILRSDFGMFYQLPRNIGLLYPTTDVLDTYIYRMLMIQNDIGLSSAAGFVQSVVGMILVLVVNWIVNKIEPDYALL